MKRSVKKTIYKIFSIILGVYFSFYSLGFPAHILFTKAQTVTESLTPPLPPPILPVCSDGLDNDGDGSIDYPNDPGCDSPFDESEENPIPPPTINIQFISPLTTSVLGSVNMAVTTSAPVNSLEFQIQGPQNATFSAGQELNGWSHVWDTTSFPNGSYSILARAFVGTNIYLSSLLNVLVQNTTVEATSITINKPNNNELVTTDRTISLEAQSNNGTLTALTFQLLKNNILTAEFPATKSGSVWVASWATNTWENGLYQIKAHGISGSQTIESSVINITLNRITNIDVSILQPTAGETISGLTSLRARPNTLATSISFILGGTINVSLGPGTYDPVQNWWSLIFNSANYVNGSYQLTAEAINNTGGFGSKQISFNINNPSSTPTSPPSNSPPATSPVPTNTNINANTNVNTNTNTNTNVGPLTTTPPPVISPDPIIPPPIINPVPTEPIPAIPPPPSTDPSLTSPTSDVISPITNPDFIEPVDIKDILPDECIISGITNNEACNIFLADIYDEANRENINPGEELPGICREFGVRTIEECDDILKNNFMPDRCRLAGISSADGCKAFIEAVNLSPECINANINNKEACNEFLNDTYLKPECGLVNITDQEQCEDYILDQFFQNLECINLDETTCKRAVRERHLASMISENKRANIIKNIIGDKIGTSLTLKKISVEKRQEKLENNSLMEQIVPILTRDNLVVTLVPAVSKLVLNEEDHMIHVSSAAVIFDTDGDGISDDIEKRLGTNLTNKDTDGDGFEDGMEIKNGFNPTGSGALTTKLSPVEKAITNKVPMEHPTAAGNKSKQLTVQEIIDETTSEEKNVQKFFGQGFANSIVTLYIYSDLPIIVTTNVDEFGNWEYTLQESLVDGQHEVYVTINDSTGRVIAKSNPFSFLIQEAKAATPQEFLDVQQIAAGNDNSQIKFYLIIIAVLIVGSISLFIYFMNSRNKLTIIKEDSGNTMPKNFKT